MLFKGAYKLNDYPRIIGIQDYDALEKIAVNNKEGNIIAFVHLTWNHAKIYKMLQKKLFFMKLKKLGVQSMMMCNSVSEDNYRNMFNIAGMKCPIYIYTNENDYFVDAVEKKYDAIYAAQIIPFKRIGLAREIKSIYILTYTQGAGMKENDLHSAYPEMKHAEFNKNWKNVSEKNELFNQSKVGLCLSKEEGPMLASLEYMLSGIPVVSTKSSGGRKEYYDPDYAIIVDDNPGSIRKGVEAMIAKQVDPEYIRKKTLIKLNHDRENYVQAILDQHKKYTNEQLSGENIMKSLFTNPLERFVTLDSLIANE
ncbi:glycosyltransferase [Pedobacter chinensis]|uniref:Glycosyltransferase n=1 Tax=Pedobacter chinensis TaxID=2282421 RepID=A0A369PNW8_9SPHI|nr:glycosyltransferase [Pedobacter chinensis]RDC54293.1 glycosyltransferase [Pedobacter chinensis]